MALVVKNPPANAGDIKTQVWSLGGEDPLEEGIATHSSILAWRIPNRGAWRATVHRIMESWTWLKRLSMHAHMECEVSNRANECDLQPEKVWLHWSQREKQTPARQPQPFIQGTSTIIITIWGDGEQREAGLGEGPVGSGVWELTHSADPAGPPRPRPWRIGLPPGRSSSALRTVWAHPPGLRPTPARTEVRPPGVREEGAVLSVRHAWREKLSQP